MPEIMFDILRNGRITYSSVKCPCKKILGKKVKHKCPMHSEKIMVYSLK